MAAKGTADTTLVKSAHKKINYTKAQVLEFKNCCDNDSGPLYFMQKYMKIQHPTRGGIDFEPYDFQLELILKETM